MFSSAEYNEDLLIKEAKEYKIEIVDDRVSLLLKVGSHSRRDIYDVIALSIDKYEGIENHLEASGFIKKNLAERKFILPHKKDGKLYVIHVW